MSFGGMDYDSNVVIPHKHVSNKKVDKLSSSPPKLTANSTFGFGV